MNKPRVILTFDCGSKTGWAAYEPTHRDVTSGLQEFHIGRGESPGMRFIRFNAWLREMFDSVRPDLVAYEQAHHRGGYATDLLVGFVTRIQEECDARGILYRGVHSATLKKEIGGSGRADKAKMIERAADFFRRDASKLDDNEADALCLLEFMLRET